MKLNKYNQTLVQELVSEYFVYTTLSYQGLYKYGFDENIRKELE